MHLRSTIATAIVFVATLVTTSTVKSGIDLTPSVTEYVALGIKYQQLAFQHDKRHIEYEPPSGWSFDSRSNQVHLKPPKKDFAEAVIEAASISKLQPIDEKATKPLEQQVIANLPAGSQFVTVEQETLNPILLNGNNSLEITVSYQSMGEKFWRSVLFVNLPDTQLAFRLTATKDDFQALHREFRTSIFSWHWIEPDPGHDQIATSAPPEQISQSH